MKNYNVKYEIGQEVYILLSKKIFKSKIEKIRVLHSLPYIDGNNNMKEMDGLMIDYLVIVNEQKHSTSYDWYNQDDIFLDKDDLFRKIESEPKKRQHK
jgi:hypothetical protein